MRKNIVNAGIFASTFLYSLFFFSFMVSKLFSGTHQAVIVTGTPGTGKTTFAKKLAKLRSWRYIDVNKVIQENNLSEGYDRSRKCKIIDEKKLAKVLEKMIEDSRKISKEKKG